MAFEIECMIGPIMYAYEDAKMTYELWTKTNPHISKGENRMNNIRWKVASIDIDEQPYTLPEIVVELNAVFDPVTDGYLGTGHINADDIAKDLESKLNRSGKTTHKEAFNTLNKQQRTAVYEIIGEAIHSTSRRPEIKDVIFNDPATIVFWTDGTKTVVKCQEGDIFDPEKGLTMAIAKKIYGNKGSYCNVIKKWCEPYREKHGYSGYSDAVTKAVYDKLSTICDAFTEKYGHKESNKTDRKYELVYETLVDAEDVLNGMSEIIDNYGFVTVADLYDISGLPGAYYTDSKIGWKGSIKESIIKRVRNGYIIDLPEPEVLE